MVDNEQNLNMSIPYYKDLALGYIKDISKGDIEYKISEIDDLEDFYVFCYYIPGKTIAGPGPILIEKSTYRIIPYGSGSFTEDYVQKTRDILNVENRIKKLYPDFNYQKEYTIRITNIKHENLLINKILDLKLGYIVPDIVGDSIFKSSKKYTKEILIQRFSNLPVDFNTISGGKLYDFLLLNERIKVMELELIDKVKSIMPVYTKYATEENMQPYW